MGTHYLQDYVDRIQSLLQLDATTRISQAEIESLVAVAVDKYSQDSPQEIAEQYNGDGGYRYALPASWESGFSRMLGVEYPDQQQTISYIKGTKWRLFDNGDGGGIKVHLLNLSVGTGDTFTAHYTARHTLTATATTIPDPDFSAVSFLAASIIALSVAGRLLRTQDSRMNADLVNFRTKSDEYKGMAKEFFEKYRNLMGLPEKGPRAAELVTDYEIEPPWQTSGYLTHGNR